MLFFFLLISSSNSAEIVDKKISEKILQQLKKGRYDFTYEQIKKSPIPGLYQVTIKETQQVLFASADGKYFIPGDMYAYAETGNKFINLQQPSRIVALLNNLNKEEMIIYTAVGEFKDTLYIFTDVDCPYCAKLHLEIPALAKGGVEVRYLAYPRSGLYTPSFSKIVSAWCADDPKLALPLLQKNQHIELKDCENHPITKHYALGNKIGVSGTPTIIFSNGELISGYHSATELLQRIAFINDELIKTDQ